METDQLVNTFQPTTVDTQVIIPQENPKIETIQIQQKVVLELEAWKKAEEAKFRVQLKQRECEFLAQLQAEQKTKEAERDKAFKSALNQINLIETKIKQKSQELQKREQKIIQLEEDLNNKVQETARIIKQKDEEQGSLIKKFKDDKLTIEKEKTQMTLKITEAQGQINKLNEEIIRLKKDMENSPIALVKGDLQSKVQEIIELKKEIEKINQIKEQYKQYYERLREEFIRQKKYYEEQQQSSQHSKNSEINKLKEMLEETRRQHQEVLSEIKRRDKDYQILINATLENPFRKGAMMDNSQKENRESNKISQQKQEPQSPVPKPPSTQLPIPKPKMRMQGENLSDLDRLIRERDYLLESGEYANNDPLIIEMTRHIQELSSI